MMLEGDVIEPTTSPYASPIVLIKKKDNSYRFCIDFRKLNRITVFDSEPMPIADDIFSKLHSDAYFSKFDFTKGFWQIPMRQEDKSKTAFVTPDGSYQFKRMPFGLVNATASFNRMMRKLLKNVPNSDSFVDDVLIHTNNWRDHMETLRMLFTEVRKNDLTMRPSKCQIGYAALDFVGHRVGEGNLCPQIDKIAKIKDATRPLSKRDLRSFLGLVGYYRNYIPNFAAIATPLTDLTKKGQPTTLEWKTPHEEAFGILKQEICKAPILRLPDLQKPFILQTDASENGTGAVLLQEHDGQRYPLAYSSKKFSVPQKSYSVTEKECLALIWGVKKFQTYLYGREFCLEVDHEPLTFIDWAKLTNSRIMRWALFLQNFRFRLFAIKGSDNVAADYLSRSGT